jgi:hypothetical protein
LIGIASTSISVALRGRPLSKTVKFLHRQARAGRVVEIDVDVRGAARRPSRKSASAPAAPPATPSRRGRASTASPRELAACGLSELVERLEETIGTREEIVVPRIVLDHRRGNRPVPFPCGCGGRSGPAPPSGLRARPRPTFHTADRRRQPALPLEQRAEKEEGDARGTTNRRSSDDARAARAPRPRPPRPHSRRAFVRAAGALRHDRESCRAPPDTRQSRERETAARLPPRDCRHTAAPRLRPRGEASSSLTMPPATVKSASFGNHVPHRGKMPLGSEHTRRATEADSPGQCPGADQAARDGAGMTALVREVARGDGRGS